MNELNLPSPAATVIVAAGRSRRMGGGRNKVLNPMAGRPVLSYALQTFQNHAAVSHVMIVGREDDREEILRIADRYCPKAHGLFTPGGAERFDSVRNGLRALREIAPAAVLIHDGARPFIQPDHITRSLAALSHAEGCVIGVPLKDTLKETGEGSSVIQTHDRTRYWLAQTPQTFRYETILNAYEAIQPPPYPTDDGQVLELAGKPVVMAEGSYLNMKITTPEDVALAEAILSIQTRIGESFRA